MKLFFLYLGTLVYFSGCSTQKLPPLQTVSTVDINQYSGKWIEIARYENRFEKGCFGATADYTLEDKSIKVINRCYDAKGILTGDAIGKAYPIDDTNAKLKVTFFWPFYGDYQVIMLADDYRYSVVGDPSRKYLWILSRDKVLSESDKKNILATLPTFGYDPSKLYWTTIQP